MLNLIDERIKVNRVSEYDKTVSIVMNDLIVRMKSDNGVNVMDEYHYKALKRKTYENTALQESSTELRTLQNVLQVSGEFKATMRNETKETDTTFIVVKGKINYPLLLGKRTLVELGMLEIRPGGSLKETN